MEELIEEIYPEEIEEITVVTTVPEEYTETTLVTTVSEEETTTITEPLQTEALEQETVTFEYSNDDGSIVYFDSLDAKLLYERIQKDNQVIINNQFDYIEIQSSLVENQAEIIAHLKEQNVYLSEMNTVLANFFFCFMVLMVCKFVHFLFYKVFFGGLT